ncbi:MAG: hypothetical protein JNL70_05750 [Saprospiraceae bacterium]|nr:hypothetical protein [Saprospiraceae bacterium]
MLNEKDNFRDFRLDILGTEVWDSHTPSVCQAFLYLKFNTIHYEKRLENLLYFDP